MAKGKMKKIDLSDLGGMVYSTNEDFSDMHSEVEENIANENQLLEVCLEKKGRGGKTVCLIKGYEGSEAGLKALAKEIKNHCGTGGSVKNGEIIIQGNVRDKIMPFLVQKGYKAKRVGG